MQQKGLSYFIPGTYFPGKASRLFTSTKSRPKRITYIVQRTTHMRLLLTIVYFSLLACSKSPEPAPVPVPPPPGPSTPPPANPPPANSAKTYLALGDSYTIGQGVSIAERFPVQTATLLRGNGINIINPQIIATTGWTTIRLQEALRVQAPVGPFDVVSLLIGVNDQFQGLPLDGYKTRFRELLQESIRLAGNRPERVFVLSIPDYSVTPFAQNFDRERISREIDAFNLANKEISLSRGVHYLDITPSTREAASNPALIASDGLHPSGTEYAKWANRLLPLMKEELE